jgi:hypothetical protein
MIKNNKIKTLIKTFTLLTLTNVKTLLKIFTFIILIILVFIIGLVIFPPFIYTSPTISINMILTSKAIASFNMVTIKRII